MRVAAVLLSVVLTALPAAAVPEEGPPPEQLFKQFGLFGEWAGDCAAPAAPENPHVNISEIAPGVILEEHDLGPDNVLNRYSVLAARRLSATELSVEVLFHPGAENEERQMLTFQVRDNTRRTMFNQVKGGPVQVKDGIVLWNGSKTPVLHKCE
jgi:hypothetical protein